MIKKQNPLLYVNITSSKGLELQLEASEKGFIWKNGNKTYNPYFPTYALVFDFGDKMMFYYTLDEAIRQLPEGRRNLKEIKKILKEI